MKTKILYACLAISVLISFALCIYIVKYDAECERVHLNVVNRDGNTVSEAEGAKKIAEAYLGLEENWELQDNAIYDVEVTFNESDYEWIIVFSPKTTEIEKARYVGIRRDNGIITEYDSMDKALGAKIDADY